MKILPFAHSYRRNAVQTASPGQLVLMLFDGALRFMNGALQGFEHAEVIARNEAVHINLVKTQAIIDELQASLTPAGNGEFTRTMSALYDFMRGQLRAANVRKEPAPIRVVLELLGEVRGAWAEMLLQNENQASAPLACVATAA